MCTLYVYIVLFHISYFQNHSTAVLTRETCVCLRMWKLVILNGEPPGTILNSMATLEDGGTCCRLLLRAGTRVRWVLEHLPGPRRLILMNPCASDTTSGDYHKALFLFSIMNTLSIYLQSYETLSMMERVCQIKLKIFYVGT